MRPALLASLLVVVSACETEKATTPPAGAPTPPAAKEAPAPAPAERAAAAAEGPSFEGPQAMAQSAAHEAALAWLALADAADYAACWNNAAANLQDAIQADAFAQQVGGARRPLGAVKSRRMQSSQYATTLPGAPDGEYVVFQFATVFEKKAAAVETITPMLDWDGSWKVSGYYIK